MLPDFTHQRPSNLAQATELLSEDALCYFGGTELLASMKIGLLQPAELVDLKGIAGLRGIRVDGDMLIIGAGATHHEVAKSELVQQHAPIIAEMEQHVGNVRVRVTGSIGGNICFAEPKSDVTTVMLALDATLVLVSPEGTRTVTVDDFLLGPYFTNRQDNEILIEIRVPIDPNRAGVYLKFQTMERPTLGVALVRRGTAYTLAVGAVGGKPERFDFDSTDDINPTEIADKVEVIPDLTGSERYKRHLVTVYVQRALEELGEVS